MHRNTCLILSLAFGLAAPYGAPARGQTVKKLLRCEEQAQNLLRESAWEGWREGFDRANDLFVCDNGDDGEVHRGASQTVTLNQSAPRPIVAAAWSRAENVGGSRGGDYSLYLDLVYMDGTPLWGQISPFSVGTHDWERKEVVVLPAKPVKHVQFHMLLRRHTGKACFRDAALYEIEPPKGAAMFDGEPVLIAAEPGEGFQVRDVAARSDWVTFENGHALGLRLDTEQSTRGDVTFIDAKLADTSGNDRAVTLVYALPVEGDGWRWLADPRREVEAQSASEYVNASRFRGVGNTRISRYPFAANARGDTGLAIGIDMGKPAFFRVAYSTDTRELFVAYDIGLATEKNAAEVRFCSFSFDPKWGFRSALAKYYGIFPDHFRCRTPEQGMWMPFAKISEVEGWEDFGFKFKEGTNETAWDDRHDIITFRYTEPHTYWLRMGKDVPRSMDAALEHAQKLAAKGNKRAQALLTSGYHDEQGRLCARFRDTPWCNGAVWSINSSPGVQGEVTDFRNSWGKEIRERLYGPKRKADLDGEYVDSSEGYTTEVLDFRGDHFVAATAALTFASGSHKPAIFRGLIAYEYIRALEKDVHGMGKLMMANSTPSRLCWLAPWLDVLGTETNWNRGGKWQPMSDEALLYKRALCGPKPFCFLMNTVFDEFPHERVEKYMKRCLAYGMFPGFFSHNASEGHYFKRPNLYNRDRPLFKRYVPLCKLVAEAGWQPITLARSSDPKVYVERFGERYLTVFNDSTEPRNAAIVLDGLKADVGKDLVSGKEIRWQDGRASIALDGEDVMVIEIPHTQHATRNTLP